MSEPLWYYSQEGRECGPVSMARLVELTAAGTVKPADLVWREGMQEWTPAGRVSGLFATPPQQGSSPAPPAGNKPWRFSLSGVGGDLAGPGVRLAQALMIFGMVVVVAARGCDLVGDRGVSRLAARQAGARQEFDDQWDTKRLQVQQSLDKLTAGKPSLPPDDQKEANRLKAELNDLTKQQNEARKQLTEGAWRDLEIASHSAKWDNAAWAYWRAVLFVSGAIAFTIGLILVGFTSQGADRWIALAMLGIVVYSVFVGGTAWNAGLPLAP